VPTVNSNPSTDDDVDDTWLSHIEDEVTYRLADRGLFSADYSHVEVQHRAFWPNARGGGGGRVTLWYASREAVEQEVQDQSRRMDIASDQLNPPVLQRRLLIALEESAS